MDGYSAEVNLELDEEVNRTNVLLEKKMEDTEETHKQKSLIIFECAWLLEINFSVHL